MRFTGRRFEMCVRMRSPAGANRFRTSADRRDGWNQLAWPERPERALPTEIWREYVARRRRCLEVRDKLQSGLVHEINDLITYNLDIRQFAQDVIASCEGPVRPARKSFVSWSITTR